MHTAHRVPPRVPPPPPPPLEPPKADRHSGLAVASLVLGAMGCTFFFAPAIQYQWAFVFGAAALITGGISSSQTKGARGTLAAWGIALGILALLAGYLGYQQVQDAVGDFNREMEQIDEDYQRDIVDFNTEMNQIEQDFQQDMEELENLSP